MGTWVILMPTVPGIPCARHWDTRQKGFIGAGEGEKTPDIKGEKGAPGLSWTKPLTKIPWNSRNIGILAGLDISVCWSAEQESESKFLGAGNLCLILRTDCS